MGFFDSEVVQQEAKQLFQDYQSLIQLGSEFGKFDREGKKIFIERMEDMMERYGAARYGMMQKDELGCWVGAASFCCSQHHPRRSCCRA